MDKILTYDSSFCYDYIHSTKVSSKHLIIHTQLRLIVKNEFVASYGNDEVVSVFGANTLNVAQQSSSFSNLNTVDVVVSIGFLLIGIASGVEALLHVYKVIGLVLQNVVQFWPKNPLSQVCKHVSFGHTLC